MNDQGTIQDLIGERGTMIRRGLRCVRCGSRFNEFVCPLCHVPGERCVTRTLIDAECPTCHRRRKHPDDLAPRNRRA